MQRSTTETIQLHPPRKGYSFSVGAKERLILTTWTSSHQIGKIRLTGWYDIFCGAGNTHTVRIDERAATADFKDFSVDETADQLIEFGLESWTDDCDI